MAKKRKSKTAEEEVLKENKPSKKIKKQSSSESESESESEESEAESPSSEEVEEENQPSSSSEEEELDPEEFKEILQPYSKELLVDLIKESISSDPSVIAELIPSIDADPVYRKIFVHGLDWHVNNEILRSVFKPYGAIHECVVVIDKVSGRSKGFGFVIFKTRAAAVKALKEPQKRIGSRISSCQLAAAGSGARRLQVANVPPGTNLEKLRAFFERFGEIEEGPLGFDKITGKFNGYAIFVYKNAEGTRKAVEEPVKVFDGAKLECSLPDEGKKAKASRNYDSRRNNDYASGRNNDSGSRSSAVSMTGNSASVPASSVPELTGLAAEMNQGGMNQTGLGAEMNQNQGVMNQNQGVMNQNFNPGALMLAQNPALQMLLSSAFGVNPAALMSLMNQAAMTNPPGAAAPQAMNLNSLNSSLVANYGTQSPLQGLGAFQNQNSQPAQSPLQGLGVYQPAQSPLQGLGAIQNQNSQPAQSPLQGLGAFQTAQSPLQGLGGFQNQSSQPAQSPLQGLGGYQNQSSQPAQSSSSSPASGRHNSGTGTGSFPPYHGR